MKTVNNVKIGKIDEFEPVVWKVNSIPEAYVRDKFQRNRNFDTMSSFIDRDKQEFVFDVFTNGNPDHEIRHFSYDDICKEFGWKSFTFDKDNNETIHPIWLNTTL